MNTNIGSRKKSKSLCCCLLFVPSGKFENAPVVASSSLGSQIPNKVLNRSGIFPFTSAFYSGSEEPHNISTATASSAFQLSVHISLNRLDSTLPLIKLHKFGLFWANKPCVIFTHPANRFCFLLIFTRNSNLKVCVGPEEHDYVLNFA